MSESNETSREQTVTSHSYARPRFGTPPATLNEWLDISIADTRNARRWSLNPFRRLFYGGRISGLEDAKHLVALEEIPGATLPLTLEARNG